MAQLHSPPEPPSDAERIAALQARNAELELELQQVEERLHKQAEASTDKQVEAALHKSEEVFSKAFRANPISSTISTLSDGRIVNVNDSFLKLTGYRREEVIGRTPTELRLYADESDRHRVLQQLQQQQSLHNFEFQYCTKSAEIRDGIASFVVVDLSGEPCLLSQVYDVTDRNRIETEQRESQQLLQGILDTAPVGIFLKNLQGKYILLNPYWLRTMGLSQEQALGKTDYDLFVPEIASEIAKRDRTVLDAGRAVTSEEVIPNPDKTRTYITKRFLLYDVAGNPYAVCGISTDISDRKRMEEELRQSEERFSKAFQTNSAATTITTLPEGRYIDVNDSFLKLLGFKREEVIGKTSVELGLWVADRSQVMSQLMQQLQQHPIYELEIKYRNKSGEIRDGITSAVLIDLSGESCMLAQLYDVTDRKRAEAALKYRLDFEALLTSISTQFINLKVTEVDQGINQALQQIGEFSQVDRICVFLISDERFFNTHQWSADGIAPLVYPPEGMELEGLSWTVAQLRQLKTIYAPSVADLPEPRKSIAQSFTVQSYIAVPIAYEGCLIGSLAFNSIRTTKTWSAEDAALLRTLADIFASALMRKRVEQALCQSEALYRTLSEAVPDLIWSCDNEGRFDFVNSRWVEYTGLTLEELNAGGSQQVNHPDEYPQLRQQWELAKQNGETFEAEFRYRRRDGIYRWFLARAVPLKDAEGNIVKWIGTSTDIHDRKQAEEQLEASLQEKEALLKEVHHRVKNNLQVISSLLDLQSQRIREPQILDVFRNSQTRVRSMALIHEKLYQSENLSKVNLADYIESLAMYLIQSYAINPDKITLQLHLEPVALNLDTAIPCGLILNELVSNALKYAFPENTGGTLWIDLRRLRQGIPYEERDTFELIVGNDGLKLPEIPDFSTAKSLGFQLVNILVQQLRGQIEVNQSQNTEFKLRFSSPLNAA